MGEEHETKALTRAEHDAIWRWINGQPSDSSVALPVARVLARLAQAELEISRLRGELAQAQPLVDAAKTWAIRANIDETTRVLLRDAHDRALDAEDRARGLCSSRSGRCGVGEPITKEEREAMLLGALEAAEAETERMREAAQVAEAMLLGALEAAEAETERMREAAQAAEADAQRLTAEMARVRPVVEAAQRVVDAADACDREAERNHPSSRSSAPVVRAINAMKKLRAVLLAAREVTP